MVISNNTDSVPPESLVAPTSQTHLVLRGNVTTWCLNVHLAEEVLAIFQLWKIHRRQPVTLDVPGVSADVFITLVLALLPVTAILTAGVDMQPLDTPPTTTPHPPGFCAFVLCA